MYNSHAVLNHFLAGFSTLHEDASECDRGWAHGNFKYLLELACWRGMSGILTTDFVLMGSFSSFLTWLLYYLVHDCNPSYSFLTTLDSLPVDLQHHDQHYPRKHEMTIFFWSYSSFLKPWPLLHHYFWYAGFNWSIAECPEHLDYYLCPGSDYFGNSKNWPN